MKENYRTVHDFVFDPSFCDWVLRRDEEASGYWQTFVKANPDKADLVTQATSLVHAMGSKEKGTWSTTEKAEVWQGVQRKIKIDQGHGQQTIDIQKANLFTSWKGVFRIAASFAAILMVSIGLYFIYKQEHAEVIQYATSYGEVKTFILPDSSEVILNSNSSIAFDRSWSSEEDREVALSGEAFFKVTHQKNNLKFKVKMANNVAIEVLGTQFTATQRPNATKVVLKEGKVKFSVTSKKMLGLLTDTIAQQTLKPGELSTLVRQVSGKPVLVKEKVKHPEIHGAFQYNKLMFVDASLTEVASVLEEVYGFHVTFTNQPVRTRRFTGSVPHDKVEVLFIALEKLYKIRISQQGKQLEFI